MPISPLLSLLFHFTYSAKPQINFSHGLSFCEVASDYGRKTTPAKLLLPGNNFMWPASSQSGFLPLPQGIEPSPHSSLLYLRWHYFLDITAWWIGSSSIQLPLCSLWFFSHSHPPVNSSGPTDSTQTFLLKSPIQPLADWWLPNLHIPPRAFLCFSSLLILMATAQLVSLTALIYLGPWA